MVGPRILLVSYHFPPSVHIGARRWGELSRLLQDRGWGLDVVHSSDVTYTDPNILERLPSSVRSHQVPWRAPVSQQISRALLRIRDFGRPSSNQNGPSVGSTSGRPSVLPTERPWIRESRDLVRAFNAWTDHRTFSAWSEDVVKRGIEVVNPERHKVVVSSGPPHLAHEAGRRIARHASLPFVADLRDAWSLYETLPEDIASPLWRSLASRAERQVMRDADLVLLSTDLYAEAYRRAYPQLNSRIMTMMNGWDDTPLRDDKNRHDKNGDETFRIRYTGAIYRDRDPRPLFEAVRVVVDRNGLTPMDIRVEMIGSVETSLGQPTQLFVHELGLNQFVHLGGWRDATETKRFQTGADLLVTLAWTLRRAMPAKIFDYMPLGIPQLILALPGSAPAEVLDGHDFDVVEPDDIEAAAASIERRFSEWKTGRTARIRPPREFGRPAASRQFLEWLDGLVGPVDRTLNSEDRSGMGGAGHGSSTIP